MRIPRLTVYQLLLEILSFVLLIATLVYIIIAYGRLPALIAGHFNAQGEVTSLSGKGSIWLLLGVEALLYVCFTLLLLFPKVIENPNMPWKLNPLCTAKIRSETISVLGECKLLCIALFSFMLVCIIQQTPLKLLPIFAISALMLLSIIIRTLRISKYKA